MAHHASIIQLVERAQLANNQDATLSYLDQASAMAMIVDNKSQMIVAILTIASCYYNIQKQEKGLFLVNEGLKIHPNEILLLRSKAIILRGMGRVKEAEELFKFILHIDSNDMVSITSLANIYCYSVGDKKKAAQFYEKGLDVNPNDLELLQSYCAFLISMGGGDNLTYAYAIAKKIIMIAPSIESVAEVLHSLSLRILDYDMYEKLGDKKNLLRQWADQLNLAPLLFQMARVTSLDDRINLLNSHRIIGQKIEDMAKLNPIVHKPKQHSNKIKIGILSSDLRNHPVGYFAWPIVNHLDKSKFELYCYSCFPYDSDEMQNKISQKADKFISCPGASSRDVAQSIADDQLDVLLELGGPTVHNKPDVHIYRAAPVQISWLGYPHSIGFPTSIDYIMMDPYIKPQLPYLLLEKPLIMPHTWVVLDNDVFPSVAVADIIPEDRNGYITFGAFNAAYKLTPTVFKVWSDIMHIVPNSRFLYVRQEADSSVFKENFLRHMKGYGISAERISFISAMGNHLRHYNDVDVALDTFPHTGGTTTCEALWMGVPVVTLVGLSFFERISYSNLNNAGLGDLCAFNIKEYQDKVLGLAADKDRRRELRQNLRQHILRTPLGDTKRFVRDFEGNIIKAIEG